MLKKLKRGLKNINKTFNTVGDEEKDNKFKKIRKMNQKNYKTSHSSVKQSDPFEKIQ